MYVLIGGAGLVGLSLAQRLVQLGHTIAVIDRDPVACHYAREQVGVMAFEGSAVNTEVLLEAGIRKADSVAAVLRSDALNLAMVTLAKHYGVSHILTRMRHRDFAEPLRLAGANQIVSTTALPAAMRYILKAENYDRRGERRKTVLDNSRKRCIDLAVSMMVNAIEYPQVESMMHFEQGQIEVLKLSIQNNCYVVGHSLAEIAQDPRFPIDSLIIGYQPHPNEGLVIPNGSTVLEPGSTVLIATKPSSLHQVIDFIEGCQ